MSTIKTLYRDYFQKSRVFLYPELDIQKGSSVTPIQTFVSWKGYTKPGDRKLICLYHIRNDSEYKSFEKKKLFGNKLFEDFREVDDNKGIYVFTLAKLKHDWDCFMKGRYSLMSQPMKKKISDFFRPSNANFVYVDSFINPERYFALYADLLNVKMNLLKEVGELCSPPDIDKETLEMLPKSLEISSDSVDLSEPTK